MEFEIVEEPIRFHLHGIQGVVENERYGEVGVYLPAGRMFVGVPLRDPQQAPLPEPLRPLEFELPRYLKHVHVGPYQELPRKWKDLQAELVGRVEVVGSPSLEIYGHHCEETSQPETTILIGLRAKPA